MREVKQVIVVRSDTEPPMRKGKFGGQCGHAVIAFLQRKARETANCHQKKRVDPDRDQASTTDVWDLLGLSVAEKQWMNDGLSTKVVLKAETLAELLDVAGKAAEAGLEVNVITDAAKTEFAEPTVTCVAIGPDYVDLIDPFTRHLKLA